jgi:predicted nucleic acid-binding protein
LAIESRGGATGRAQMIFEFAVIMRDRPPTMEARTSPSPSTSATASLPRSGARSAGFCGSVATGVTCFVTDLSMSAVNRSARLMERYADTPMDLADATLVALAEETGQRKIFSLDSDFHIYRIRGRQRFEVVPAH